MARLATAIVIAAMGGAPALAQGWEVGGRLTASVAALDEELPAQGGADGLVFDGALSLGRRAVLDNGVTLDWRGELRVQGDADGRPAFAGAFGACPAGIAGCPLALGPAGPALSPIAPATGLAAGGLRSTEDMFAAIERASLAVSGPWGEAVIGLDAGVAARLDARAPRVLEAVSAMSPTLDPTGLVVTRARNDVTGPSAKVSYLSPRWLGLRLGVSHAPEANLRGADFDPRPDLDGGIAADLGNVWEGAASFDRRFRSSGIRVRAAITYTTAESDAPAFAGFGDYEALGAGLELERGDWTAGARWLASDNARAGGQGDYSAGELALVRDAGDWRIGAEAGWSNDDLVDIEGWSWLVGAQRRLGEAWRVGLALASAEAELPVPAAGLAPRAGHINARNRAILLEISVRN